MKAAARVLLISGLCAVTASAGVAEPAGAARQDRAEAGAGRALRGSESGPEATERVSEAIISLVSRPAFVPRAAVYRRRPRVLSAGNSTASQCDKLFGERGRHTNPSPDATVAVLCDTWVEAPAAMHFASSETKIDQLNQSTRDGQQVYLPQAGAKIISEGAYTKSNAPTKPLPRDALAKKLKQDIEDALSKRNPSAAKQQPGEGSLEWTSQPQSGGQSTAPKATGSLNVKIQTKH